MGRAWFAVRHPWLLRALGRGPLIRISDRFEALAVILLVAVALIAVPVASRMGDDVRDARMRTIAEQTQTRHEVNATAVTDSTRAGSPRYSAVSVTVRAQWREGTAMRTETVTYPKVVKAGAPLAIWLDRSGKVVAPPDSPADAMSAASGRTWATWLGTVVVSLLIALAFRHWLDRLRLRAWERELQLFAHNDDGWANRHP